MAPIPSTMEMNHCLQIPEEKPREVKRLLQRKMGAEASYQRGSFACVSISQRIQVQRLSSKCTYKEYFLIYPLLVPLYLLVSLFPLYHNVHSDWAVCVTGSWQSHIDALKIPIMPCCLPFAQGGQKDYVPGTFPALHNHWSSNPFIGLEKVSRSEGSASFWEPSFTKDRMMMKIDG